MPAKTLIIGCGYVGLPLGLYLHELGHEISGWVHSSDSACLLADHPLHRIYVGSVGDQNAWNSVDENYDNVIHCVSSGKGGVEAYEEVFLKGVMMVNTHQPEARRIFVSSTSVYGQTHGRVVTEISLAEPITETGMVLREAEKVALDAGTIVVRSGAIYGPTRSALFEKFRKGEAIIEGDGTNFINQIHANDLATALAHLTSAGEVGQIYNAVDDTPVTYNDYYTWCSRFLHKPMPAHGPINPQKKRGLTNKQVSNAKLRATDWSPLYPSFREGLEADCAAEV